MIKFLLPRILTFLIFLFCNSRFLFATPPLILSYPSNININEEFLIEATFSGLSGNKIYRLRSAFFNAEKNSYFGETWNGSEWYKAESPIDYTKFLTVVTNEDGAWSGQIKGRVSYGIPNFDGKLGAYNFKVGRYTETGVTATWSEAVSITINDLNPPSSTPTQVVSPTSNPNPTSTPIVAKATYKINDVKDNEGNEIKNAKIYVDDIYIHHYAPEVLTFCDGCTCDGYVPYGFGTHEIRLEKTGYEDWMTEITINAGENKEVNPVMNKIPAQVPKPTNTPIENTQTPTKKPTQTPTKKANPSQKPTLKPTPKPQVLGKKIASLSAFLISSTNKDEKNTKDRSSSFKKDIPKILILFGTLSTLAMILTSFYLGKIKN